MDMGHKFPRSFSDPSGHSNQNLGSMKPTSYPSAHSDMHTDHELNGRSTLTPQMSNLWTAAPSFISDSASAGYNFKSEKAEGETIKTEPESP